jgi:hypothetical protein
MDRVRYRAICRYAGAWLDEPLPRRIALDQLDEITARSGVYVVCEPQERVQYVGSVCRPRTPGAVARRLREHLQEGHKRLGWKWVWVVPLKLETPLPVVRSVEACIGADLAPRSRNRLPKL